MILYCKLNLQNQNDWELIICVLKINIFNILSMQSTIC